MDREMPEGNTDLYILRTANKWHPYAAKPLPITSPLTRVCVRGTCQSRVCLLCGRKSIIGLFFKKKYELKLSGKTAGFFLIMMIYYINEI